MKINGFDAKIIKTSKIAVSEDSFELPPHLGEFEEFKVSDYYCPEEWSNDGVFIAVEENQPLWIDLRRNPVCACLPSIQRVNPITGEEADLEKGLTKDPKQNYLSLPRQQWLDGYANEGKVYQFVVTKSGINMAVNEFALPKHMQDSYALGFAFFAPKNPPAPVSSPLRGFYGYEQIAYPHSSVNVKSLQHTNCFAKAKPLLYDSSSSSIKPLLYDSTSYCRGIEASSLIGPVEEVHTCAALPSAVIDEVGVTVDTVDIMDQDVVECDKASMAAGGRIDQNIVSDDNTVDYYHEKPDAFITFYLALPDMFEAIMKKGKRQDASKKDKYVHSGKIGNIQIPLVK